MIVVADTSPLLHLARIGRLDFVVSALSPVIVPQTVWSELIQPGTRADVVEALRAATWIELRDDPSSADLGLDPGETAAILLAEALCADAVLIDERSCRGGARAGRYRHAGRSRRRGAVRGNRPSGSGGPGTSTGRLLALRVPGGRVPQRCGRASRLTASRSTVIDALVIYLVKRRASHQLPPGPPYAPKSFREPSSSSYAAAGFPASSQADEVVIDQLSFV